MKNIKILSVALATTLLAACGGSKNNTATDSSSTTTTIKTDSMKMAAADTTMADTVFAKKAAIGGLAEVALGKMAAMKTQNSQIKEFAKMMVMDHGKANDELLIISRKNNFTFPAAPDAEHKAKADSLSKLTGADFDKAYVATMVEGHQKTLALMNKEAQNGKDPDLKTFATKTAPTVQKHLDKINAIQSSMK